MKLITSFFRMIRWGNLVFIILTQTLFYTCIYLPIYPQDKSIQPFIGLVIASVLIAAAGYIINDYFDLNIDQVNKPGKNVINTVISRRWAIFWHLFLSFLGILATAVAVSFAKWYLIFANIICVMLLWLYSTSFKRRVLIGNVVISLLTAWTILILFFTKVPFHSAFGVSDLQTVKFFRVSFLYAGFAFIISLIREAIKDVEDMEGDRRYGCRTLPIVAGVPATKIYISVWLVVIIIALIILQLYILQFRWWFAVLYSIAFVILPLFLLFIKLHKASTKKDYAQLSNWAKWIIMTGILSMIFFLIYL
jgi:4-hydroxybenzoate polyprenyltransferase